MSDDPTKETPEAYLHSQILRLTGDVGEILQILAGLTSGQSEIAERLSTLETTVEKRLMETRPIWEAMQAQLDEVASGVDNLNRKFDVLHGDILQARADERHLRKRVDELEKKASESEKRKLEV